MKFSERLVLVIYAAREQGVEHAHDLLWYAYSSGKITTKQLQYAFNVLRAKRLTY